MFNVYNIPIVVLICGYRGSGKNTFASVLQKEEKSKDFKFTLFDKDELSGYPLVLSKEPFDYKEVSFAYSLKMEVGDLLGMSISEIDEQKDIPFDSPREIDGIVFNTPRDVLIHVAKLKRDKDPDYFAKLLFNMEIDPNPNQIFLITDWRYLNEFNFLKEKAIIFTVRIQNDQVKGINCQSENSLDAFHTDFIAKPSFQCQDQTSIIHEGTIYHRTDFQF